MTGSPTSAQDGLSEPNVTADAGSRQPNGTDQFSKMPLKVCTALKKLPGKSLATDNPHGILLLQMITVRAVCAFPHI